MEDVQIEDIQNEVEKAQFLAINVDSIRRVKKRFSFNPDRYRLKTKVFSKDKRRTLDGLIDTGCNTDALSLEACQKLGIDRDIKSESRLAAGVDGKPLKIIGTVDATVYVGKVPYTSTFPVLSNISGFDVMIGTKFLNSSHLMAKVVDLMKNNLGSENVEPTN